jgi:methyltransferase (TIGR00027 family)
MARADGDTWDLTKTVGATATMVAAARAAASKRADPVVDDPFAEPLVRAVGVDFFTRLAQGELDFDDIGGEPGFGWMPDLFGIRAWYFDDFFSTAWETGIRQVVNVAAGLDSRAYRLEWPDDTTIYEVDRPEVVAFKNSTLADLGATPTADLRSVGVDLRDDWPDALREAGFDHTRPTAWITEGLLIGFLPGGDQDRLLEDITDLSTSGSQLAADYLPLPAEALGSQMRAIGEIWREHGADVDLGNLYYSGERNDVDSYLISQGWDTTKTTARQLFDGAGVSQTSDGVDDTAASAILYVTATRR